MAEIYQLDDGTSSIGVSPIRGDNVPEDRIRQVIKAKDQREIAYEWGGKQAFEIPFNNMTKAEATQLITWWQNMTTLSLMFPLGSWLNCDSAYFAQGDDVLNIAGEDFEASFWMIQDGDPSANAAILTKWNSASSPAVRWGFYLVSDGRLVARADDNTNDGNFQFDITPYLDNTWHHYHIFVKRNDIDLCTIYVDGAPKVPTTVGTFPTNTLTNTEDLTVGSTDTGVDIHEGSIRDVRLKIGGTRTTPSQIRHQANNRFDYSANSWTLDGTREFWKLNEGTGTNISAGVTSPANDLTLNNVAGWQTGGLAGSYDVKIDNVDRPPQMWGGDWDTLFAGIITVHEISSVSFSSSSRSVSGSRSCSSFPSSKSCSPSLSRSCELFLIFTSWSSSVGVDVIRSCSTSFSYSESCSYSTSVSDSPSYSWSDSQSSWWSWSSYVGGGYSHLSSYSHGSSLIESVSGSGSSSRSCSSSRSGSSSCSNSSSESVGVIELNFYDSICGDVPDSSCSVSAGGSSCSVSGVA